MKYLKYIVFAVILGFVSNYIYLVTLQTSESIQKGVLTCKQVEGGAVACSITKFFVDPLLLVVVLNLFTFGLPLITPTLITFVIIYLVARKKYQQTNT